MHKLQVLLIKLFFDNSIDLSLGQNPWDKHEPCLLLRMRNWKCDREI